MYNAKVILALQTDEAGCAELPRHNPTTPALLARFLKKQQEQQQRFQQCQQFGLDVGTAMPGTSNSAVGMDAGIPLEELLCHDYGWHESAHGSFALDGAEAQQPSMQPAAKSKQTAYYRKQQTRTTTIELHKLDAAAVVTLQRAARWLNATFGIKISTQYNKKVDGVQRSTQSLRSDVEAAWNTHMPNEASLTLT